MYNLWRARMAQTPFFWLCAYDSIGWKKERSESRITLAMVRIIVYFSPVYRQTLFIINTIKWTHFYFFRHRRLFSIIFWKFLYTRDTCTRCHNFLTIPLHHGIFLKIKSFLKIQILIIQSFLKICPVYLICHTIPLLLENFWESWCTCTASLLKSFSKVSFVKVVLLKRCTCT